MRYLITLRLAAKGVVVLICLFAMQCFASDVKINFRKDTGTMIPGEIQIQGKETISTPIGDTNQGPILKLKINNQGPFYFELSTSAPETIISERLAKTLKLKKIKGPLQTINTNEATHVIQDTYMIDQIEIGGIIIKDYAVMATGIFGNEAGQISSAQLDGYLSANAFYGLLLTLDLKSEKIQIEKGKLSANDENVIPFSIVAPVPIIKAQINFSKLKKEVSQHFALSTENFMYIYVNACKIPEMHNFKGQQGTESKDIMGNEKIEKFAELYGDIIFSKSIVIKSPYIYFGEINCEAPEPIGLLGEMFFEKYKVAIDLENSLVRIEKY